jgi:hypothetical protein
MWSMMDARVLRGLRFTRSPACIPNNSIWCRAWTTACPIVASPQKGHCPGEEKGIQLASVLDGEVVVVRKECESVQGQVPPPK